MPTLSIDYVLEGTRRGYNFTSPTDGVDPVSLKAVWRGAMPRGQGWENYPGASSLKCFPLESGEAAICEVTLTDLTDEVGRKGIRRAFIHLLPPREYQQNLLQRLAALPREIVTEAERRLSSHEWELLFRKYRDAKKPKTIIKPQTILAYPYTPEGWWFVEACILLLATRSTLLTNLIEISPAINPFADRLLSFTTLALDYREEGRIVALPLDRVQAFGDIPYIDLR